MTAYEIYDIFKKLEKPEYYDIANQNALGNIEGACQIIQDCFDCDKQTAEEVIRIMNKTVEDSLRRKGIEPLTREQKALNNEAERLRRLSQPKCPTCQSTNLKKISTTSKLVDIAVWGVFGSKRHKTFHCNHCGYEW